MLVQAGKLDQAMELTEPHVGLASRDAEMLRLRALLERQAGRMGAAAHFATRAEAIEPHPDTLLLLAQAESHGGQTDRALERCRMVLGMLPGHVPTRLLMAQALESAVRTSEARDVL